MAGTEGPDRLDPVRTFEFLHGPESSRWRIRPPPRSTNVHEEEYAFHGGSFPIIVKGTGLVGTLTISGLAQELDHALAVPGHWPRAEKIA